MPLCVVVCVSVYWCGVEYVCACWGCLCSQEVSLCYVAYLCIGENWALGGGGEFVHCRVRV